MSSIWIRVRTAAFALGLTLLTFAALGVGTKASALLISADFGSGFAGAVQPLFSGVEPKAAALDARFGAANVWNDLTTGVAGLITDPSWSSLLDATGGVTGVALSITGTVESFNGASPTASSLTRDYMYWNAGGVLSSTLSWTLSGLVPGASYALVFYGANTDVDRTFDMSIDGVGSVGAVATANSAQPEPLYVVVTASAGGLISGTAAGNTTEADWAGFQIASIPEPTTALLLAGGLGLLGAARRRERLSA